MQKSYAEIDGFPVLASGPVTWSLRSGTTPFVSTFDITPAARDALQARDGRRPVTLTLGGGPATGFKIEQLWILGFPPGPNPHIARVTLADRRWFWPKAHVLRRFNMRRLVGQKTVQEQNNALFPILIPGLEFRYTKYSLKNGVDTWTVGQMLEEVVQAAGDAERRHHGVLPPVKVDWRLDARASYPLENIEIDDPGDQAVGRALVAVAEADVFVDANGDVVVYARTSGRENETLRDIGQEHVGAGHIALLANEFQRPREVHVLFTREVEVRFDYTETNETGTRTVASVAGGLDLGDDRAVENVLPVPDQSLKVLDERQQRVTVSQGVWITIDQALEAWNNPINGALTSFGEVTHAHIQRAMVPFNDLWGPLRFLGLTNPAKVDWQSRIAALVTHWRRTYRMNPRWVDSYISAKPYRIATLDRTSGQRAPSPVYMDWCALTSLRTFITRAAENNESVVNVTGYPTAANGFIGATTKFAPALVNLLDQDQGVIQIDLKHDPVRTFEMTMPGKIDTFSPGGNLRRSVANTRSVAFNASYFGRKQQPRFASSHKMATILTLIPAAPNNSNQLYRVVVSPDQVRDLLPPAAAAGLGEAKGPPVEIRIGATVETARTEWVDARANDIAAMFGFGIADRNDVLSSRTSDLVVNNGERADARGAGSLKAIARAAAAKYWASLADHLTGGASGTMNYTTPLGWCDSVTWNIDTNGVATTRVTMPDKLPELSLFSLLDAKTRAVILHQVQ